MSPLKESIAKLKYGEHGLIPAIIVDADSKTVLMVAYMNKDSLADTVRTGKTHFWSRRRKKHWLKGERSGHTQDVKAIYTDCDNDTLLVEVHQNVAACHKGYFSCFYRKLNDAGEWDVVADKIFNPEKVYGKKK